MNKRFLFIILTIYLLVSINTLVFGSGITSSSEVLSIDSIHQRIHQGLAFTHSDSHSVGAGANLDLLLKNPTGTVSHLRFTIQSTNSPITITMYEGTTVSADGASETVFNLNRTSLISNNMTMFAAPTVTGVGTVIYFTLIPSVGVPAGSGGFSSFPFFEVILNQNTNYLVRINNGSTSTATVGTNFFWYELLP